MLDNVPRLYPCEQAYVRGPTAGACTCGVRRSVSNSSSSLAELLGSIACISPMPPNADHGSGQDTSTPAHVVGTHTRSECARGCGSASACASCASALQSSPPWRADPGASHCAPSNGSQTSSACTHPSQPANKQSRRNETIISITLRIACILEVPHGRRKLAAAEQRSNSRMVTMMTTTTMMMMMMMMMMAALAAQAWMPRE